MTKLGDLYRDRRGRWAERAPAHCPDGHQLGPNRVLVGHAGCSGDHPGGHRTWFCREPRCGLVVYGPPPTDSCRLATGPDER